MSWLNSALTGNLGGLASKVSTYAQDVIATATGEEAFQEHAHEKKHSPAVKPAQPKVQGNQDSQHARVQSNLPFSFLDTGFTEAYPEE